MHRLRSLITRRTIVAGLIVLCAGLGVLLGPLALSGPQIVRVTPAANAADVNPQAPIRVEFDQWVRIESVASAVTLDPAVPFAVTPAPDARWGTTAVLIQPQDGLRYGARYRLTVAGTVENLLGRSSGQARSLAFTTLPYVAVTQFAPEQQAATVGLRAPITVSFSAPVVPAASIAAAAQDPAQADALPQPLTLAPETPGIGRWLSPTLFGFYPTDRLSAATTYTATLLADLTADGRARLAQPLSWSFTTEAPLLAGTRPFDGAAEVAPTGPIEVRLAEDVDVASASRSFSLHNTVSGAQVAGAAQPGAGSFTFQPAAPLDRGVRYEARLAPGIRTTRGAPINQQPVSWSFAVMGPLAVDQVEPPLDAADVLTDTRRISVRFNHPVVAVTTLDAQAGLPQPLRIAPALAGEGRWLDTSTYVFSPTAALAPATRYQVSVIAGVQDQTGSALAQPYSWSFTTILPQVLESTPAADAAYADPRGPLTVRFNQPMELSSLQRTLTLQRADSGAAVPGSIRVDGSVATFRPETPLERGARYLLSVAAGAQSAGGAATLGRDYRAPFQVAPLPRLISTNPADSAQPANLHDGVTLTFSAPIDWPSLERNLAITPPPTSVYTYTDSFATQWTINFSLQPETDYRVTVGTDVRDIFGTPLGQPATFGFRSGALPPTLALLGTNQVGSYNAYQPVRVPLRHVNLPDVSYRLYRMEPQRGAQFIAGLTDLASLQPEAASLVREATARLGGGRNQEQIGTLDLGQLDAGMYYLRVADGVRRLDQQIMIVSRATLTLKRSTNQLFVWAVDLQSGQPVADLPLTAFWFRSITDASGNFSSAPELRELGRTDREGVLEAALSQANSYDALFVWSGGERFSYAATTWSEGIAAWDFGLPAVYEHSALVGNIATDRPLYRPSQTVHLRGALRLLDHERYQLPEAEQQVALAVTDPNGTAIYSTTLALSPFGTFNTSLTLSQSAALGNYAMSAQLLAADAATAGAAGGAAQVYGSFAVAEYRKPAFELTVTPSQPDVIEGERLTMAVAARYFSGGALPNAPVRWRLLRAPLAWESAAAPGFRFVDLEDAYAWYRWEERGGLPGGRELVSEGTGTTDAQGRLSLTVPTEAGALKAAAGQSQLLLLDVEVTDLDGQVIAAQGSANVHAGAFYIGLRPQGYMAQVGASQPIDLVTRDPQDRPVAGRALEVSVYQREWYSAREQGADGRLYWTSRFTDTLVTQLPATTDAQGRGSVAFKPSAAGMYRITATGRDDGGRTIRSSAFTWAYGNGAFWGVNDTNRIDLIADKTRYAPGETARILVPTPYREMTALMTIERGEVLEHRLLRLSGTAEVLEVPLTADYAPNVYVSLVLIKPAGDELPTPELRVGLINLPVATTQQELNLRITPSAETAGPRDEVRYTIQATDYTGRGVRAEVALALVDKAVLTLADDPNPTLSAAFYEKRPLAVSTSQSLTTLVERVRLRLQQGAKGGGGGSVDSDVFVRRDFPDTAYWNPTVVTGDDGRAQVTVKLPDSLTTWRMTARGLTADTRVGQVTQDIVATRPLLIRPSLPRFLTVGDTVTLQAMIHNTSPSPIAATAELTFGDDPAQTALKLGAPAAQTVQVPANGQVLVRWPAEVPAAGTTLLRFRVTGGGLQDAVEQPLPIQRFMTPEVVASAGQVRETTVETLQPAADRQGELRVELLPSLAAGVERGLDYLEQYPYECTEQTVSRFLPNAVTYRLLAQLGLADPALKTSLERNLATALQRLTSLQQLDGGWGWWATDRSDPYLTAYVVQGLLEARKAGAGIDQSMLDRALAYLQTALANPRQLTPDPATALDTRSYILFVLAEAGRADRGRTVTLFEQRAQLDIYARAYLLMTLKTLGAEDERVRTLIGELMSSAILHPTDAHWEERAPDYWTMSSDTRSTALALQALVRADPGNFLVPNAVRYLMAQRSDGHWRTTQESAAALLALSEYLAQSGELAASYSYRAALDGRTLREGAIDRGNLADPIELVVALADLARNGPSQLTLQRQASAGQSGQGGLYYTLRMRYYEDAAAVQPLDQGLAVQREYSAVDTATLTPTGQLISQARLGDVVQVRLTLTVPENVQHLAVEDLLPAGLEPLDTSLKTVSAAADDPSLADARADRPYWWYWSQTEIHDNRVVLFATDLPRGTYHYTYLARASAVGTFQTLPATAYQMYAPEVFGRSAGARFEVTQP